MFAELIEGHVDDLYTFCLRMLGTRADADEICQATLVRAYENRHRYDAARPVRPWLLTIAANLCRSHLRSVWWRRLTTLAGWDRPVESAEPRLIGHDRDAKVRAVLKTLPVSYREAIGLFHLDGMSYEEMSAITSTDIPALKQRVRRGREMLRQRLARLHPELCPEGPPR